MIIYLKEKTLQFYSFRLIGQARMMKLSTACYELFLWMVLAAAIDANNKTDDVEYAITTKTGNGPGCGTDASFNVTFITHDNNNITFLLDGEGDKLETSHTDRLTFRGKLVYPIDQMVIQRVEKKGWSPDWYIHWLTLDVNDTLYVFRINRWISNDQVRRYYGTLGRCKEGYDRIQKCQARAT